MKQLKDKEYEEFQLYLYNKAHGYIWTPETLELICNGNDADPEQIGKQMLAMAVKLRNEQVSHRLSDKHRSYVIRGQGIGSQLMVRMLELLKWQGYERASLAVQKANYAVRMYENVGFKTVDKNDEEYIMVCEL